MVAPGFIDGQTDAFLWRRQVAAFVTALQPPE
jgi:hypothetical protein